MPRTNSFCRQMLCISAAYTVMRCLFVCLSVTFVSCVKTNKQIFKFFLPSGSQAILVFPYQTAWQYSVGNPPPPNGGVECRWSRQKSRFWANIWLHGMPAVNAATAARCCQHAAGEPWQVVTLRGRRRRNVYDVKSQRYAKDNRTTFNYTPM